MPLPRIELRVAAPADRARVIAMQRQSLRVLGRGHYTQRQIESYLLYTETLEDYLVADGTYFIACVDGIVAGCGGWSLKAPAYAALTQGGQGESWPKVRAMYVNPAFARRGIGTALVGEIERAMAASGHREAALDATLPGVALYERCGYRAVGSTWAVLPDGERLGFVCMRKSLPPDASCAA